MADIDKSINITTNSDEVEQDLRGVGNELDNLDTGQTKVTQSTKDFGDAQKVSTQRVTENGGAVAILDSLTGGMATQFRDASEATKLFNFQLKGTRTALIATGIGAIVVALGLIILYWGDILELVGKVSISLEDQLKIKNDIIKNLEGQVSQLDLLIELEELRGNNTEDLLEDKKKIVAQQQLEVADAIVLAAASLQEIKDLSTKVTFWESINATMGSIRGKGQVGIVTPEELETIKEVENALIELQNKALDLQKQSGILSGVFKTDPDKETKDVDTPADKQKLLDIEKTFQEKVKELKTQGNIDAVNRLTEQNIKDLGQTKLSEISKLTLIKDFKEIEVNTIKEIEDGKLEDQRKSAVKEIEDGTGKEEEKQLAIKAVNDFYKQLQLDSNTEHNVNLKQIDDDFEQKKDDKIKEILAGKEVQKELTKEEEIEELEVKREEDLLKLEELEAHESEKVALIAFYKGEILKVNKKFADDDEKIAKELADAKKSIQNATINTVAMGFRLLGQMNEENKGLQIAALLGDSAAGIAKIIIDTQSANAAVTAKYALLPGGVALAATEITLNRINAGLGIASNVAATAKALSVIGGGGNVSQPSEIPQTSGGGQIPQAQFNLVGTSGSNQIAEAIGIGNENQEPIRAFVVSDDITTQQALDRNRQNNSTFL